MKTQSIFVIVLLLLCIKTLVGQITFYVDENISYPDISVKIGDNVSYPDVRIKIGENISYEDFTVGITNQKSQANFIITTSKYRADKTIRANENISYPDLRIKVGENISYPDVRIEIKKSGTVDYIVYTEKAFMTMEDLIIALLPAINKEMDYELEDIPTISGDGSGMGVPEEYSVIAHSLSTQSEARKVLSQIGETSYSLSTKNLVLVVCRSGLMFPLNSSYDSLGELNSDADSQLNISGENFHIYIFQMNNDGSFSENQHVNYKAEDW